MYSVIEFYIFPIFSGIQFCITNCPTSFNWIIKNLNEKKKKKKTIIKSIFVYFFYYFIFIWSYLFDCFLILSISIYNVHNTIHYFIIDIYQFSVSNINFKKDIECFIIYYWWINIHQLIFELIYRIFYKQSKSKD